MMGRLVGLSCDPGSMRQFTLAWSKLKKAKVNKPLLYNARAQHNHLNFFGYLFLAKNIAFFPQLVSALF
jgi:hypothetical protein